MLEAEREEDVRADNGKGGNGYWEQRDKQLLEKKQLQMGPIAAQIWPCYPERFNNPTL